MRFQLINLNPAKIQDDYTFNNFCDAGHYAHNWFKSDFDKNWLSIIDLKNNETVWEG